MDKVVYVSQVKYPDDTAQAEKAFEMMDQGLKVMFENEEGLMVLRMFQREGKNHYSWEHYYPGDYDEWFSSGGCLEPKELQRELDQLSRSFGKLIISDQNKSLPEQVIKDDILLGRN